MRRPRILVTLDTGEARRREATFPTVHQKAAYGVAVERAGGLPLWVGPPSDAHDVEALLDVAEGVVVTGGDFDIPPADYGAAVAAGVRLDPSKPARTSFEAALVLGALARGRPVLGICGGMQLLNVVLGGTLIQHIPAEVAGALEHEQPTSPAGPAHPAHLEPGGLLAVGLGRATIEVNSTHHQAVARLGSGLIVEAVAPDGVIEAIADRSGHRVGVQWHPELLDDDVSRWLYGNLVDRARASAVPLSASPV